MKYLKTFLIIIFLMAFLSCAQFETIDRADVNRPSMDMSKGFSVQAPASLTQLKSANSFSAGACNVCAQ